MRRVANASFPAGDLSQKMSYAGKRQEYTFFGSNLTRITSLKRDISNSLLNYSTDLRKSKGTPGGVPKVLFQEKEQDIDHSISDQAEADRIETVEVATVSQEWILEDAEDGEVFRVGVRVLFAKSAFRGGAVEVANERQKAPHHCKAEADGIAG